MIAARHPLSVDAGRFWVFISKPSRQLPDNRKAVNYLSVRILQ